MITSQIWLFTWFNEFMKNSARMQGALYNYIFFKKHLNCICSEYLNLVYPQSEKIWWSILGNHLNRKRQNDWVEPMLLIMTNGLLNLSNTTFEDRENYLTLILQRTLIIERRTFLATRTNKKKKGWIYCLQVIVESKLISKDTAAINK